MKKKTQIYVVQLCGRSAYAYVIADSWEQATLQAAKYWDIPWGKNVSNMSLVSAKPWHHNVCIRCGSMFQSGNEAGLCQNCRDQRMMEIKK